MNCNCNNENNKTALIKHVFGNVLRLAIPLTLRTVSLEDGEIVSTDTDFIPSNEHPVRVEFTKEKGITKVVIDAVMRDGNVACVEDEGTIPIGTYAITVTCKDNNAKPYRFKQRTVLTVTDYTADAGIQKPVEFEVKEWYLDAAIFLALKGEDGVGIQDIETQTSTEVGGVNTVTFILTDGRTRSFTVLNGSGNVDDELDINSRHPLSNSAITTKFNAIDEALANIFGDVDYESGNKVIRFWDKGKTKILATLDATPFIKDGMVNSVYISNNTLVITFNTESGKEPIGVPLTSVFNPNNYYNKTQVDNRIAAAVAGVQIDTSGLAKLASNSKLRYNQAAVVILDHINGVEGEDVVYPTGPNMIFGAENGHIILVNEDYEQTDLGITQDIAFYDKTTEAWYRYSYGAGLFDDMGWHQLTTGGISEEDDPVYRASVAATITQAMINTWNAKQTAINDLDTIRAGAALGATALQPVTLFMEERSGSLYFTDDSGPISDHEEVKRILGDVHNSVIVVYNFRPYTCKRPFSVQGDEFWLGTYLEDNTFYSLNLGLDSKEIYIDETVVCEMARSEQLDNFSRRVVVEVSYTNSIDSATYSVGGVIISLSTLYGYIQDESTEVVLKVPYYEEENGNNHGPYTAYLSLSSMWADKRRYYCFRGDVIGHYTSDGFVQMVFAYDSRSGLWVDDFVWDINTVENLSTVAYSGSYDDLEDKPTIPAAYDDSALDHRVSVLEGFMEETPSIEDIPTKTSDLTNDSDFTTQAYVDAQIAQMEIGETVVVNTDGANIVDSHTNPSIFLAPSARQMMMMANNITTLFAKINDLFDRLAAIAFTDTKPSSSWKEYPNWIAPVIPTHSLSYELSRCSADVRPGLVGEGGLHVVFTPEGTSDVFAYLTVNGDDVTPVPTGDVDGSVYIDIIVNNDVRIVAVAVSGYSVGLGAGSSDISLQKQNVLSGQTYRGTLVRTKYHVLPTSISATMGGQSVTFGQRNTYDNKTGEIVITNVADDVLITAVGVIQSAIDVSMTGHHCGFLHNNDEIDTDTLEIYEDDKPYEIDIIPDSEYRFDDTPEILSGSSSAIVLGPFENGGYKLIIMAGSTDDVEIYADAVEDVPAELTAPLDGAAFDIGAIESGDSSVSSIIHIEGNHFTRPVELTLTGATGFTLSKYELTAAEVNTGIDVAITYTNAGSASVSVSGTLEIKGENLEESISITITAAKRIHSGYVTSGLLMHLDGKNQGSTQGVWMDSTLSYAFTLEGSASVHLDGNNKTDGVEFSNYGDYAICSDALTQRYDSGTIEICFTPLSNFIDTTTAGIVDNLKRMYHMRVFFMTDADDRICAMINTKSASKTFYLRSYGSTFIASPPSKRNLSSVPTSASTISQCYSRGMVNGVVDTSSVQGAKIGRAGSNTGMAVGGMITDWYLGQQGETTERVYLADAIIHEVRVYNRQLTQEEMLQNQKEDNRRYGLGIAALNNTTKR